MIRTGQLAPYCSALADQPQLLESLLRKHWLPLPLQHAPDGIVLEAHSWAFLEDVARVTGRADLGWELAFHGGLDHLGTLGRAFLSQIDLNSALAVLMHGLPSFSNASKPDLYEDGDVTWFCRGILPGKGPGFWQVEQYATGAYIRLIRHYAGHEWQPRKIRLQAKWPSFRRSALARCCPDIEGGASRLEIAIERELLAQGTNAPIYSPDNRNIQPAPVPLTLGDAMIQVLRQYMGDYPLNIDTAGQALWLHPRTIIRRLASEGLRFRDIRDALREEKGRQLLASSTIPASQIARQLGYQHPGNFSRAIKRLTGTTPTELRNAAKAQ